MLEEQACRRLGVHVKASNFHCIWVTKYCPFHGCMDDDRMEVLILPTWVEQHLYNTNRASDVTITFDRSVTRKNILSCTCSCVEKRTEWPGVKHACSHISTCSPTGTQTCHISQTRVKSRGIIAMD